MIPDDDYQFQYRGRALYVWGEEKQYTFHVYIHLAGITERVHPTENGLLTSPKSKIASELGQQRVILLPWKYVSQFTRIQKQKKLQWTNKAHQVWFEHRGAAQAGLLYGELVPKGPIGWYVVLMMKCGYAGIYVDYVQPGHVFLGKNPVCEAIYRERGSTAVYRKCCDFVVTEITGSEIHEMLQANEEGGMQDR